MALNRTKTVALTAAITMGAVIASTSFAEARRLLPAWPLWLALWLAQGLACLSADV